MMFALDRAFAPDRLQLVDRFGTGRGEVADSDAHRNPGRLHRAFSVFLLDAENRLLIQRRSIREAHSAGSWSSTCSGHPSAGESPGDAARRLLAAELRIASFGLAEAGTVRYHVTVPALHALGEIVEHEWCHVLVGRIRGAPAPHLREAGSYDLVPVDEVPAIMSIWEFTAWFRFVWRIAEPALAMPMGLLDRHGGLW